MDFTMDSFAPRRPRCPNWTEQDKIILVKNIRARKEILLAKNKGDAATKDAVATAWQEVLNALNSETHFPRTLEQVKKQHENLKLRAKQLYMDMMQCPGTVKPHIVSPAMKLMMEDFTEGDPEFSNPTPTPTANRILLPKQTVTLPITLPPLTLPVQSLPAPSTVNYEDDDSNTNTSLNDDTVQNHSISIQGNNAKFDQNNSMDLTRNSARFGHFNGASTSQNSDNLNFPNPKRRKLDNDQSDSLLANTELEKIRAETEKLRAETELIYQRKEYELAIFELKRQVLEAKLEYYTKANEKGSMSEQTMNTNASERDTQSPCERNTKSPSTPDLDESEKEKE
ncbi:uncharacterized protein LOC123533523 [Mercenaria mercenaria]|uniref:uncharacterized protein LOC123533523 n=1 Tax=Mercenaria mercenaria TaxID=6596 RepID=UPI00234EED66|nr:uncharacterized protein LOC123533523 [Mercenaria mercenaria]